MDFPYQINVKQKMWYFYLLWKIHILGLIRATAMFFSRKGEKYLLINEEKVFYFLSNNSFLSHKNGQMEPVLLFWPFLKLENLKFAYTRPAIKGLYQCDTLKKSIFFMPFSTVVHCMGQV